MPPAPLVASPPEIDQITAAAPPLASVAENCSTVAPCALAALQAVQFVSIELVPGKIEKVAFDGLAVTCPAQPATASNAGSRRTGKKRSQSDRARKSPGVPPGRDPSVVICAVCNKISGTFLAAVTRGRILRRASTFYRKRLCLKAYRRSRLSLVRHKTPATKIATALAMVHHLSIHREQTAHRSIPDKSNPGQFHGQYVQLTSRWPGKPPPFASALSVDVLRLVIGLNRKRACR